MKRTTYWPDRQSLADLWHSLSQVTREQMFGPENDRYRPMHNLQHAALPALGWVGQRYRVGGLVILAANPGGGGDGYRPALGDAELYDCFAKLRAAADAGQAILTFDRMTALYLRLTMGHNISLPLQAVLQHGHLEPEQCAFLNIIPFRTRGDAWPGVDIRRQAIKLVLAQQLLVLMPGKLVCLGKKACDDADRYLGHIEADRFCIPRHIGDRSLHPDALPELERLRTMS
jgi:hypothetical protein